VCVGYLQGVVGLNKAKSVPGFRSHIPSMVFTIVRHLIFNNVNIKGIKIQKFLHAILCTDYINLYFVVLNK